MERLYQITHTEKYDNDEEEVTLCSSVVEGRKTVPLFLANTASKTFNKTRRVRLCLPTKNYEASESK